MSEAVAAQGEVRLLIDGELVDGRRRARRSTTSTRRPKRSSARSPTPSPRRHGARHRRRPARLRRDRLVDQPRVPQALPRAAAGGARGRAARSCRDAARSPRSAAPIMLTYGPQLDAPLDDACTGRPSCIDEFEWEHELPDGHEFFGDARTRRASGRSRSAWSARSCRGTSRSRSPSQARPGARHRQHGGAQARARHAVERHAASAGSSPSSTDIPAGVLNVVTSSDHLVGEVLTRRPARRHDLVHRLDRGRQADHGEGRRHDEARCSSSSAASRRTSSSTTPTSTARRAQRRRRCACTPARAARSRRGMLLAALALRRGRRAAHADDVDGVPTATRSDPSNMHGPADHAPSSATGCSATSRRAWPKAPRSSSAAAARRSSTRATSSSRRCSPTSTTR